MFADFFTPLGVAAGLFGLTCWVVLVAACRAAGAVGRRVREDVEGQGGTKRWAKRSAARAGGMLITRMIKSRFG